MSLLTGVDSRREGSPGHELFVEGDVDDVVGALERHEADDEPGRALRVHLRRDVAASSADRYLEVALTFKSIKDVRKYHMFFNSMIIVT